jgi:hypothetical protein
MAGSLAVSGSKVYLAGSLTATEVKVGAEGRPERQSITAAVVWENGKARWLTTGKYWASAQAVAVFGKDVYVVGKEFQDSGVSSAMLWKNGEAIRLTQPDHEAEADAVSVSGHDVLVAGYEQSGPHNVAMLWKNGEAMALTDGTHDAYAKAVAASGADIYVVGKEDNGTMDIARVWKNRKELQQLTDGIHSSTARAMAVAGTDVFVAGDEASGAKAQRQGQDLPFNVPVATVWMNGRPVHLSAGNLPASAYGIAVSGPDVYVAGIEWASRESGDLASSAVVWKLSSASNQRPEKTVLPRDGSSPIAYAIAVVDRPRPTGHPARTRILETVTNP